MTTKTKKAIDPALLTPEYIEEQRRLRNLRKQRKQMNQEEPKVQPPQFIKREMLEVSAPTGGFRIKIMTYNMLAQGLVRRKLFPTSGAALKWDWRSKTLLDEIIHYSPDLICMQEVDHFQYKSFWRDELAKHGYRSNFHRNESKTHGVCIVFRSEIFLCPHQSFISYDKPCDGVPGARRNTENVGLLNYLEFQPDVVKMYPGIRSGLIVGTTHLFWHPFGTFERTRQCYLILRKFQEFTTTLRTVIRDQRGFYTFFAGDMNSQPFDSPYLSMTAKPVEYKGRAKTVLACSLLYKHAERKLKAQQKAEKEQEGEVETDEQGTNTDQEGENKQETETPSEQPRDPCPEFYDPTPEEAELCDQIRDLHNRLATRAISLYSVGYKQVHPENAGVDNDRNEPFFSNWAHAWRGLLDYIFVLSDWNGEDYSQRVDTVAEVEQQQGVRLLALLQMPEREQMGEGQPRIGEYPSDHLCMMAEVELPTI